MARTEAGETDVDDHGFGKSGVGRGPIEVWLLTSRYLKLRFLSIRLPAGRRHCEPPVPRESGSARDEQPSYAEEGRWPDRPGQIRPVWRLGTMDLLPCVM
jgi:hypothetical protein